MPKILDDSWPDDAAVEAAWNRALASGLNAWVTEEGMRAALIAARDTAPDAKTDGIRNDELRAAYVQGCLDVHNNYRPDSNPDFTEAAYDYVAAIKRAAEG